MRIKFNLAHPFPLLLTFSILHMPFFSKNHHNQPQKVYSLSLSFLPWSIFDLYRYYCLKVVLKSIFYYLA